MSFIYLFIFFIHLFFWFLLYFEECHTNIMIIIIILNEMRKKTGFAETFLRLRC